MVNRFEAVDLLGPEGKTLVTFFDGKAKAEAEAKAAAEKAAAEKAAAEKAAAEKADGRVPDGRYRIRYLFPHLDVSSAGNRDLRSKTSEEHVLCV